MQLVLKDILRLKSIKEVFELAAKAVEYFRHSPKQYVFLRRYQEYHYGKHSSLVGSVITRWGSSYRMVKSLLRTQEAARDWARKTTESSVTKDVLRDMGFWNKLEELAKLLVIIDEPLRMSVSQSASVMKVSFFSLERFTTKSTYTLNR